MPSDKDLRKLIQPTDPQKKIIALFEKGNSNSFPYIPSDQMSEEELEQYINKQVNQIYPQNELNPNEKVNLYLRARKSFIHELMQKQNNLETIFKIALEEVGDKVSDEPVDANWRAHFFEKARNVSTEEMQKIWGKILAGEVMKPGTVSLRTLDIVSKLTSDEARFFEKYCAFVNNHCFVWDIDSFIDGIDKVQFRYSSENSRSNIQNTPLFYYRKMLQYSDGYNLKSEMQDAGLVKYGTNNLYTNYSDNQLNDTLIFWIGQEKYKAKGPSQEEAFKRMNITIIELTQAGRELSRLLDIGFRGAIKTSIIRFLKSIGIDLKQYRYE